MHLATMSMVALYLEVQIQILLPNGWKDSTLFPNISSQEYVFQS